MKQIPVEVSLDLVNVRSNTERTPLLDSPPRPGSVRVKISLYDVAQFKGCTLKQKHPKLANFSRRIYLAFSL
jgi:hypothetical protein